LECADIDSTDETFNKVVSNKVLNDLKEADAALLDVINNLGSYTETIST
jgi:hypothetical protein